MLSAFISPGVLPLLHRSSLSRTSPARPPYSARRALYRLTPRSQTDDSTTPAPVSTSSAPTTPSAPPAATATPTTASDSSFRDRFDHLRGADIEPVSVAMDRFTASFRRPIPVVYRAVINETISVAHLARVCAMWRFDAVFALGFDSIFSVFLRFYPNADERDQLYVATASALKFEHRAIVAEATSVSDWLDGKTEADILDGLAAAPVGASADAVGPVIEALAAVRDAGEGDFYYSRLFGLGLIQIMSTVGAELNNATADKWADAIGLQRSKLGSELGNYLSGMERLKQAEQIFAEATAREAKKTADRLAEKARLASEEADQLEKDEKPAAPEQPVSESASEPEQS